jgi:hypothetical protein
VVHKWSRAAEAEAEVEVAEAEEASQTLVFIKKDIACT